MDKENILKAKLDLSKTFTGITIAATLTCSMGYWANIGKESSAKYSWLFAAILLYFAAMLFLREYLSIHDKLIKHYSTKKKP